MDIKKNVNRLVRLFGTRNPFEILKGMNVIVVKYPLGGKVRGFYYFFQGINVISLNELLPDHEMRLTCAHELGHMLLHKTSNMVFMDTRTQFNTDKYENQADTFAAEMLIPDELILENINLTETEFAHLLGYQKRIIKLRLNSYRTI